jgi:ribonuclease P/MRP protein subunit RPP40
VVLNGKSSDWMSVLSGVPQCSVLGPILFLVFINNLDVQTALVTIVRKFADDTKLGQVVKTDRDSEVLQNSLDKLTAWADTWGMSFNVKKCVVMHFGHNNPKRPYYMNGEQLLTTKEERDIRVLVSDTLKPSAQCAKAAKTASQVLGQLSRAFHYRDRFTFVGLYKQYVLPHLEFAGQALSPWTVKFKEILEKVQRRAIGMVSGLLSHDYDERLKELKMTTLEERRHQSDMLQVFKILKGHDNVKLDQWFKMAEDGGGRTRQATGLLKLSKPRVNLEVRANFFSVRVVDSWNSIPDKIKMSKNPGQFKRLYKAHRCSLGGAVR